MYLTARPYGSMAHGLCVTINFIGIVNSTVDVGVNRTNLSLHYYHGQVIVLVKQYSNCFVDVDKLRL